MKTGILASILAISVLVAAFVLGPSYHVAAQTVTATEMRVAGDVDRTRFVIDLNDSVEIETFALDGPYRVVVDLPETAFDVPPETGSQGRGLISAFRFGLIAPGKSRVVLDVASPVEIDKAFVLDPVDGQPARLVVDLVKTDRASFMRTLAVANRARAPRRHSPAPVTNTPVGPGGGFDEKPIVVLDPGHGGIDPGAISRDGTTEKEIVLAFAERLAARVEATGAVEVELTRDDDRFIPLAERVEIARKANASLFISLHADSISVSNVSGATVYTLSDRASDREAALLAEKENRADAIGGVDLSDEMDDVAGILIDLVRRETQNFSILFARGLVGEMRGATRMNKNPLRSAGFRVLKAPDVPSVLIELGYLTNAEDRKLMLSEQWQTKVADSIVEAVMGYFGETVVQGAL